jgi:hypothetical protein
MYRLYLVAVQPLKLYCRLTHNSYAYSSDINNTHIDSFYPLAGSLDDN